MSDTKFHDDGTVTIWDVYQQGWSRTAWPEDCVLASLSSDERDKVIKHCRGEDDLVFEMCSNHEWVEQFSSIDVHGVADIDMDDAVDLYTTTLWDLLVDAGFSVCWAKGNRRTCHGWNGNQTFRFRAGGVGTFGLITEGEEKFVFDCVDKAEAKMKQTWEQPQ